MTLEVPETTSEALAEAVQRGLRLLAQRPRTEAELRERLTTHHGRSTVEAAVARLRELGYIDDAAWAALYVSQRRATLRSSRLLVLELERRGVAREVARAAVESHDDDAAAERLAQEASRRLAVQSGLSPLARRRRLHSRLARRGFGHATIERALASVQDAAEAPRA